MNAQPKPNPKTINYVIGVIASLCIVCLCLIFATSLSSDTTPSDTQPFVFPTSKPPAIYQPPAVRASVAEYKVLGSGSAFITYESKNGTTEQVDVRLPWSYPRFQAISDSFLYVSAQLDGTGTITCLILINGSIRKKSTSDGQYVICTADMSAP